MTTATVIQVGTTPVQICKGGSTITLGDPSGKIFLGGEGVTPATGMPYNGPLLQVKLWIGDSLWAVAESGKKTVGFLRTC